MNVHGRTPYWILSLFTAFVLLSSSWPSQATISLVNITGRSNLKSTTLETAIIAGLTGIERGGCSGTGTCDTCSTCDRTTTCNTAAPGTAGCCGGISCCACNTAAVHDGTVLTINFTSNTVSTGLPQLVFGDGSSTNFINSTGSAGSGGNFSFTTTWNNICDRIDDASANCAGIPAGAPKTTNVTLKVTDGTTTDQATLVLKVYKQANAASRTSGTDNDGALAIFTVYPGDEKVYIEDPEGAGSFPQSSVGLIENVRFYVSSVSLANAYLNSELTPVDLKVDSEGGLDEVIDGLENDKPFHFRAATMDESGNIFNVMDDTVLYDANAGNCANITSPFDANADPNCRFAGVPSRVVGLLTEDMNCFVATAAYGSHLDPHIDTFREFRFKVLLPSEFGRSLNYAYYKYGPYAARFVSNHEWARTVSQVVLWPAWGVAKLSLTLQLKLWQTLLLCSLLGAGFMVLFAQLLGRCSIPWKWTVRAK